MYMEKEYDTNHILIDILKDRKSSTIREFLLCHKDSIKKVGMDMFMQFRNTVYSCLPHADIVADKYHVIRQANWDDKGCEDKIIQFRHKVQGIQEILEADSKESKQCIQSFTEEEAKETEEPDRRTKGVRNKEMY